jgi:insulysin
VDSAINGFGTGNLKTLTQNSTEVLQECLRKYYKEHYSSNLMSLCIVGVEPLDALQEMVVKHFAPIENKNLTLKNYLEDPMYKNKLGSMLKIVPVKDVKQLKIEWPTLEQNLKDYKTQPLGHLTHVIGHEGENSILSELTKQGLVSSLNTDSGNRMQQNYSHMTIDITLTQKGVEQVENVIRLCFAIINKFRQKGP